MSTVGSLEIGFLNSILAKRTMNALQYELVQ